MTDTATTRPATKGFRDGITIAAQIASGETTSAAEVDAAIARAGTLEPKINAIATEMFGKARAAAAAPQTGPFSGVPSLIKDLVDWQGAQTLYGSRAFKGYIAAEDAPFATKWRAAGIIPFGKSTTPEMGLISSTEPLVTGPTRNPWDLSRIPGGSSGGAAAIVAARIVPFAQASDGGGSIRIPAACCGVFGLKPSAGIMPLRSGSAQPVEISVQHAVTISVRDSIALFKAAAKPGTANDMETVKPLTRRLKIGYAPDPATGTPVHPATRKGLEDVAGLCRELGHEVIDYRLPFDGDMFSDKFLLLWAAGAAEFAKDASAYSGKPIGPEILEPWTLGLAADYMRRKDELLPAIAYLQGFKATYEAMFEDFDILLSPVTSSPAVKIGEQAPTVDYDTLLERVTDFAAFTSPMNVSGAASMSVPLAWSDAGLPIGAMFSGKQGDDALLFELALELEAARPWADKVPPIQA